jgi:hypothetical protein
MYRTKSGQPNTVLSPSMEEQYYSSRGTTFKKALVCLKRALGG